MPNGPAFFEVCLYGSGTIPDLDLKTILTHEPENASSVPLIENPTGCPICLTRLFLIGGLPDNDRL